MILMVFRRISFLLVIVLLAVPFFTGCQTTQTETTKQLSLSNKILLFDGGISLLDLDKLKEGKVDKE